MFISYFKNLSELDKTIDNVNTQYANASLPTDIYEVESMIREHDASKQAILEMFKFTQNESEQIIARIRKQVSVIKPFCSAMDLLLLFSTGTCKRSRPWHWQDALHIRYA